MENWTTTEPKELVLSSEIPLPEDYWAVEMAKSNPTAALPSTVRLNCEELLLKTIHEVDEETRPLVDTLIHLAWYWANGLIPYRHQSSTYLSLFKSSISPLTRIDMSSHQAMLDYWRRAKPAYPDLFPFARFEFERKSLDLLYSEHKLERLFPLLRTGRTTTQADTPGRHS